MLTTLYMKFNNVKKNYTEDDRKYHASRYPSRLLSSLQSIEEKIEDYTSMEVALWWCKAVLDPHGSPVETANLSIARMRSDLDRIVHEDILGKAAVLIEALGHNESPHGLQGKISSDMAYFVDAAFSFHSVSEMTFIANEELLYKEFDISACLYSQNRLAIVRRYLTRDRLYHTEHFQNMCEIRTRCNFAQLQDRLIHQLSTACQ